MSLNYRFQNESIAAFAGSGYHYLIQTIKEFGSPNVSRLGLTKEALALQVDFNSHDLFMRPKANRKIGWVEALQTVAGDWDPERFKLVAPNALWEFDQASSDYGTPLAWQLPMVVEQLEEEPLSRRAVVYIDGAKTAGENAKPCTSMMQFVLRRTAGVMKLHTIVTMRSWDLISGFMSDHMTFGLITQGMAAALSCEPGRVYVTAGSAHIYLDNKERFPKEIHNKPMHTYTWSLPSTFDWTNIQEEARYILAWLGSSETWPLFPSSSIVIRRNNVSNS